MRLWRRIGLRGRLALALSLVAAVSVVLATVLANGGLHSRLDQFAQERLQGAATHGAELAALFYRRDGGWTTAAATDLGHAAALNGYRLVVTDATGHPVASPSVLPPARPRTGAHANARASARVLLRGRTIGTVTVTPIRGQVLTGEDRSLRHRLNRLHLLAGALALALGLLTAGVMAPALARPLRRLTDGARKMQSGELQTRVAPAGAPELRELGYALNRLAETLEHEERIRRDAAADVAHELRTPLAGIVSRIEAAQDHVLADEARNLDAMHTEALRLTRLVDDLGTLADAQQPGLTLQKEPVDLRALVHESAEVYRDSLQAKGIALNEHLAPARVSGDPGRIVQIVDNLLSNALRYTDPGGTVTIDLSQRDSQALLEVADTGIGIRGEDLPYIFERSGAASHRERGAPAGPASAWPSSASSSAPTTDASTSRASPARDHASASLCPPQPRTRSRRPRGPRTTPFTQTAPGLHASFTAGLEARSRKEAIMSITSLIFIALLVWMVWMHTRPGGHGGCGGHGSHRGGEHHGR